MAEMNEEQRAELMEKLKKMSPEELREFQKKQCIFCQIMGGKMESKKVYEDDLAYAILDINPATAGHILLMPKEHYAIMPQMPEEVVQHLGKVAKKLSLAVLKGLKVQGTTIFVANGLAAGQRAQHFMMHIIPRSEGDSIGLVIPQRQVDEKDLTAIHQAMQEKVNALLGVKKEIVQVETKEEEKSETKEEDKGEVKEEPVEEKEKSLPEEKEIPLGDGQEDVEESEQPEEETEEAPPEEEPDKKEDGTSLDDIAELFK
jgi:histidine triad (HIT) family protein